MNNKMTLTCRIFGHKYGDGSVEEKREDKNEKTAIIEVSKKRCSRCGNTVEERLNTRITDKSSVKSSSKEKTKQKRKSDHDDQFNSSSDVSADSHTDNTSPTERKSETHQSASSGYTKAETDILDEDANGGVILSDNNGQESSDNKDTTNDSHSIKVDRASVDDEGVVVLGDKDSTPNQTEFNILCESCEFSRTEKETSRRDGDICPKCGSWLTVEELHD